MCEVRMMEGLCGGCVRCKSNEACGIHPDIHTYNVHVVHTCTSSHNHIAECRTVHQAITNSPLYEAIQG